MNDEPVFVELGFICHDGIWAVLAILVLRAHPFDRFSHSLTAVARHVVVDGYKAFRPIIAIVDLSFANLEAGGKLAKPPAARWHEPPSAASAC